jgi:long-chain acyl-CoA synthetase
MYIKLLEDKSDEHDIRSVRLGLSARHQCLSRHTTNSRRSLASRCLRGTDDGDLAGHHVEPLQGVRKPVRGTGNTGVEVAIFGEADNAQRGEVGEIAVRGPNVMKGYWKKPGETEEAFKEGWFRTGDLGKLDDEGYLTIVGRKKEMIIASGFKVFPREVEEVIHAYPKVKEVAVVGLPDPVRGESVKAFIVLRKAKRQHRRR